MDPKSGHDFKIIKKVKQGGQFPEYGDSKFMGVSALSNDEATISKWMAARHDIYALRKIYTEDELKKALKIYKGVEQDPRQTFNPEEFMPKAGSTSVPTAAVTSQVVVDDEDLSLADDDFIKGLRNEIESN
jgi:hypothetical protein